MGGSPKAAAAGAVAGEGTSYAARGVRAPQRAVGRERERPLGEAWAGQEAVSHGTAAEVENLRRGGR